MDASLPVRIVETQPSAMYLGKVYTQSAIFALKDGREFRVYDPSRYVSPDFVGTDRFVELKVLFAEVTSVPDAERAIKFDREDRPVFRGRVVAVDKNEEAPGVLDVGTGTIRFDPGDCEEAVAVGEFLQLTRSAIHLKDVKGRRQNEHEHFLDLLRNGTSEERRMAARHLGTFVTERGIDDLIEALCSDDDPAVRAEAATALGRSGMSKTPPLHVDDDSPIITHLRNAENDENNTVAEAAHLALEDIEKSNQDHYYSREW